MHELASERDDLLGLGLLPASSSPHVVRDARLAECAKERVALELVDERDHLGHDPVLVLDEGDHLLVDLVGAVHAVRFAAFDHENPREGAGISNGGSECRLLLARRSSPSQQTKQL